MIKLRTATIDDRTALIALLAEEGMDYIDPPEDYVLAVEGETIAGCGRVEDHGHMVMLRPLVVAKSYRRRDVGRRILEGIMPADKPTGLVARSHSVAFYQAVGFSPSDWSIILGPEYFDGYSCLLPGNQRIRITKKSDLIIFDHQRIGSPCNPCINCKKQHRWY